MNFGRWSQLFTQTLVTTMLPTMICPARQQAHGTDVRESEQRNNLHIVACFRYNGRDDGNLRKHNGHESHANKRTTLEKRDGTYQGSGIDEVSVCHGTYSERTRAALRNVLRN